MVDLAAICSAVDFIEEHLKEAITVADMADAVSYSLYHFSREFNQATHHTPYNYLMRRRLTEAAKELLGGERRIIDIACDHQFSSPEAFSRGFRRVLGSQPSQVRRQGDIDCRLLTHRLRQQNIEHVLEGRCCKAVCETRGESRLLGLMAVATGDPAAGRELWDLCRQALEQLGALPAGPRWAVRYYPERWWGRRYFHSTGIEPASDWVRAPLVVQSMPAARYVRFTHLGSTNEVPRRASDGFELVHKGHGGDRCLRS